MTVSLGWSLRAGLTPWVTLTEKPPQPPAHQRQSGLMGLVQSLSAVTCLVPPVTAPLLLIQKGLSVLAQHGSQECRFQTKRWEVRLSRVLSPLWVCRHPRGSESQNVKKF